MKTAKYYRESHSKNKPMTTQQSLTLQRVSAHNLKSFRRDSSLTQSLTPKLRQMQKLAINTASSS